MIYIKIKKEKEIIEMKRNLGSLITLILLLSFLTVINVNAVEVEYITVENCIYIIENGNAVFGNYHGSEENIIIPSSVNGYTVIGFEGGGNRNSIVTSITIPDSVTYIGDEMFRGWHLKSITIPNSVTSIGRSAFECCYSLETITIPESVITVGDKAFSQCDNLTEATILNGVIGWGMFERCYSLKTVNLGENITELRNGAFYNSALESIIIPESIEVLGNMVFGNCKKLTSVVFKNPNTKFNEETKKLEDDNWEFATFLDNKNMSNIYAFTNTQAQRYAAKENITFTPIARATLNGTPLQFDIPPIVDTEHGRVLVPMRAIFEALGAEVGWDNGTQTATAVKSDKTVSLQIGSPQMRVNNSTVTLDATPQIVLTRTLVPLRAVSEALGATVSWDQATQTVNIVN